MRGPRFDVVPTGGGLRVKRHLLRVHMRGWVGPGSSLYVGERITLPDGPWKSPRRGYYISEMPYETVRCAYCKTLNGAIAKAKMMLRAKDAAQRLSG